MDSDNGSDIPGVRKVEDQYPDVGSRKMIFTQNITSEARFRNFFVR